MANSFWNLTMCGKCVSKCLSGLQFDGSTSVEKLRSVLTQTEWDWKVLKCIERTENGYFSTFWILLMDFSTFLVSHSMSVNAFWIINIDSSLGLNIMVYISILWPFKQWMHRQNFEIVTIKSLIFPHKNGRNYLYKIYNPHYFVFLFSSHFFAFRSCQIERQMKHYYALHSYSKSQIRIVAHNITYIDWWRINRSIRIDSYTSNTIDTTYTHVHRTCSTNAQFTVYDIHQLWCNK